MTKTTFKQIFLIGACLYLNACIEIKDNKKSEPAPAPAEAPAQVQPAPATPVEKSAPAPEAEVKSETTTVAPPPAPPAEPPPPPAPLYPDLGLWGEMYVYQDQIITAQRKAELEAAGVNLTDPITHYEMNFEHLTFTPGSVLYTLGNNITIKTNFFNADRGYIKSFPAGRQATYGRPSYSGGNLTIFARHADGQIFFEMRGEKGFDGYSPPPRSVNDILSCLRNNAESGTNGSDGGDSGSLYFVQETAGFFDLRFYKEAGAGGAGGQDLLYRGCMLYIPNDFQPRPGGQSGKLQNSYYQNGFSSARVVF